MRGGPGDLTLSNGRVFLSFEAPTVSRELFTFDAAQVQPPPCATVVERASMMEATSPGNGNEEHVISYPNPFVNEFSILVNGPEGESYQAMITDVQGIRKGDVMHFQSNIQYHLGSGLVPGVYILIVIKPNEKVIKKIIKSL